MSQRQQATVREDYREGGDAWDCFTHDQACSRAYRRGEDCIAVLTTAAWVIPKAMAYATISPCPFCLKCLCSIVTILHIS